MIASLHHGPPPCQHERVCRSSSSIQTADHLIPRLLVLLGAAIAGSARPASAQDHASHADAAKPISWGAHAIGVVTRQSPAIAGRTFTEGYLTQPTLMSHARLWPNVATLQLMLSLEGLTLDRGELNPGIAGEGYVDRRHPHTYLHELAATLEHRIASTRGSLTIGKGFAPFGTDDPMARPFVKYPINHHLAQILERIIAVAAVNAGPFTVEAGTFNGDEPESAGDAPNRVRLWDSWAARATVVPVAGTEIQASYARVRSPEFPAGGGPDDRKWSVSGRLEPVGRRPYVLAEWARTAHFVGASQTFTFSSFLVEAEGATGRLLLAGRLEVTERADEERLANPFRTLVGGHDFSILGRSRWTIGTVRVSAPFALDSRNLIAPFAELAYHGVRETLRPSGFVPKQFYGSNRIWVASVGAKLTLGERHRRMGRYGVALPSLRGNRTPDAQPTQLQH